MVFSWRFIPGLALASSTALARQAAPHCAAPKADLGGPVNAHTRVVERHLLLAYADATPLALEERMRTYAVPGVSVAVVHDGKLEY